jgi:hypothetical protein
VILPLALEIRNELTKERQTLKPPNHQQSQIPSQQHLVISRDLPTNALQPFTLSLSCHDSKYKVYHKQRISTPLNIIINTLHLRLYLPNGHKELIFLTIDNDKLMKAKNELQKNKYDEADVPVERSCPIFAVSEASDFQLLVGCASGLDVCVGVCVMLVIEVRKCLPRKCYIRQCSEKRWEHQYEVNQVKQKETPSLLSHVLNAGVKQRPSRSVVSLPAVGDKVFDHSNGRCGKASTFPRPSS